MKGSRFTEEQIIGILREQAAGAKTADVCREHALTGGGKSAAFGVRSFIPNWRPVRDSNPCYQRERMVTAVR